MSKISTKKINIADYSKDNQSDISKLARSLNPLMDDIERAFRKGLTVEENLPFQYLTFSCQVDSSGNLINTTSLISNLTTSIRGALVVNATNSNTYPNGALGGVFVFNGSSISVLKIFGIPANTTFEVTILVVA